MVLWGPKAGWESLRTKIFNNKCVSRYGVKYLHAMQLMETLGAMPLAAFSFSNLTLSKLVAVACTSATQLVLQPFPYRSKSTLGSKNRANCKSSISYYGFVWANSRSASVVTLDIARISENSTLF